MIIAEATAYTIPLEGGEWYLSIWQDAPAEKIKLQLKNMLKPSSSKIIELDPRAAKMTIKALADMIKKDVS